MLLAVYSVFVTTIASAQCVLPFEEGAWTNDDPNTGGITRITVGFDCDDVTYCGIDADGNVTCEEPSAPFSLHLWGNCSPSDCNWGTSEGNIRYVGSTQWVYSRYDHGFATRFVYIKPSTLKPGHLYLWMYTAFVDPGRSPYIYRGWFHK